MLFKPKEPPLRDTSIVDDMELEHPLLIGNKTFRLAKKQLAITRIWRTIPVQKISTHVKQITVRRDHAKHRSPRGGVVIRRQARATS